MKLNPDCVRAVLLTAELSCTYSHPWVYCSDEPVPPTLSEYSSEEILYHLRQCHLSNLLSGYKSIGSGRFAIVDLSPAGHEFLANIRTDRLWHGVKAVAKEIGSSSLDALCSIAMNVVDQLIKSHFQL